MFIYSGFPFFASINSGEIGIRTLGPLAGSTVFETAPIDHSGISPFWDCKVNKKYFTSNFYLELTT